MSTTTGPALSGRVLTSDEVLQLKAVCDEHKFSYAVFCALIVKDVLSSQELLDKYIKVTQQFEDDQRPASVEELKVLRKQLRQQEAELESLRQFKKAAQDSFVSSR